MDPAFSIVIPVYNEQDSLRQLFSEIYAVSIDLTTNWEVIFVDDGSTDDSWSRIEELAKTYPQVCGVQFRRNFGKAAALTAGVEAAQFPIIFTMDADLQDNPVEIPRFLAQLNEGQDVVSGWKQVRNDPMDKTVPSRVFNFLVGRLTGVKLRDHNCGFKCYRREVFDEVRIYGELHRFVPVLAASYGFRIGEMSVQHRARQHGKSKYGWRRIYRGLLDLLTVVMLTNYRQRPQHLIGLLGGMSLMVGIAGLTAMGGYWVMRQIGVLDPEVWSPLHQRPIVLYALGALLLGGQLMSVGLLAELLTAQTAGQTRHFSIRQTTPKPQPPVAS
ncbi:MAG: glycosyltransferase family 2 protein [Planctomycetaceae bacterium]|nr:glycosyltransferase family 2 protein [Planctomycetaceae bacterium]